MFKCESSKEERAYEKCVLCKIETKTPINLHVDLRQHYVIGMGELCDVCYEKYISKR